MKDEVGRMKDERISVSYFIISRCGVTGSTLQLAINKRQLFPGPGRDQMFIATRATKCGAPSERMAREMARL
jgi:hypothetical protein